MILNDVYSSKEVWKLNFREYGQMEKHSQEEAQTWRKSEGRRQEREKIREGDSQKREDADARKGSKSCETLFFLPFLAPEGRQVGSLKRRVPSQPAR